MRVYKEGEAVAYLEKLNASFEHLEGIKDMETLDSLDAHLGVELAYFRRLNTETEKKNLVSIVASSTGFPEMESLLVDVKKAYQDLDLVQTAISQEVVPLFKRFKQHKSLADFNEGISGVLETFEEDKAYFLLLKKYQNSVNRYKNFKKGLASWCLRDADQPEILHYYHGPGLSKKSLIKFIDSQKYQQVLIDLKTSFVESWGSRKRLRVTTPTSSIEFETSQVLEKLEDGMIRELLSIDYTELPDGIFHELIESSNRLGPLLEHIKADKVTALEKKGRKVWFFR